jgi:hypothetical protein
VSNGSGKVLAKSTRRSYLKVVRDVFPITADS